MSGSSVLRRRQTLWIATTVGVALVVFVAVLATRSTQSGTVAPSPLVGQAAPAIAGINVMTGDNTSLASERGHYVVVAFFASWCVPCAAETPQLVAFLFAERSLHPSVLGVIDDDSVGNAQRFLRSYGAKWPAVADTKGTFAAEYGVTGPPEAFVVSPTGRIIYWIPGGVTESRLLQIIALGGTA